MGGRGNLHPAPGSPSPGGDDAGLPLIYIARREGKSAIVVNLDPVAADFYFRAAWFPRQSIPAVTHLPGARDAAGRELSTGRETSHACRVGRCKRRRWSTMPTPLSCVWQMAQTCPGSSVSTSCRTPPANGMSVLAFSRSRDAARGQRDGPIAPTDQPGTFARPVAHAARDRRPHGRIDPLPPTEGGLSR